MTKAVGDPVTALDLEAEQSLRAAITDAWPTHGFVGEETGAVGLDREYVWVVDPIDGTANFAADLTPWGVAVACLAHGTPVAAAVFTAPRGTTTVAATGRGARVDGERIHLRDGARLGVDSLIGTQWFRGATELPFLPRLLSTGARIRVLGSTVAQMCDVAAGRLHANVQAQGRLWDIAAPALIVIEAGGEVTDWRGHPLFPRPTLALEGHHPTIAGAPSIVRQVARLLRGVPLAVPLA